jgi:Zn-dependent protease with chaperone function
VLETGAAASYPAISVGRRAQISAGLRRLASALPAMVGSALLLSVAGITQPTIGLGVVAGWVGVGVGLLSRPGERLAARTWLHVRTLSPAQERSLAPLLGRAITIAGITVQDIDAYIHPGRQVNAYAFGGHSVALTRGLIIEHGCGRLSDGDLVAVLVHEFGHLVLGHVRFGLLGDWYSGPSRLAWRLMAGLPARVLGFGRHPRLVQVLLLVGSMIAVVRGAAEHAWPPVAVLLTLLLVAIFAPIANAACSRRAERAADRFAADRGMAHHLAHALTVVSNGCSRHCLSAVLASHPTHQDRLKGLLRGPVVRGKPPPSPGRSAPEHGRGCATAGPCVAVTRDKLHQMPE